MAKVTRNLGMLVLAVYLIIIGVVGITGIAMPIPISAIALAAGVLILIGK